MKIIEYGRGENGRTLKGEIVPACVGKDGKTYVIVLGEDGLFHRVDIDEHAPK